LLAELRSNNLSQEAIYQQKARIKWLKQGDLNTKYFHSTIKWRRARNGFNGVRDNGVWYENQGVVKDKVRMYFKGRFSGDDRLSVKLHNACFNKITEEDNIWLVGRISDEEVKEAVWSCGSDKSPRPDGFNFSFIKLCWEEMKADIITAVHNFEDEGRWPRGTNASFISLIPKVENPQSLNEFRSISLVGCLYKIVAKILSRRLKKVLHKVIDVRHSAFLEGRGIMDSVLVANEVLEDIKRRKSSCIFFKVDYEKAYDSIDWSFLFYMLERLGFCGRWVGWIRACLESSSVSVLVNGSPTQEFKPRKGVRQGDPLAPFLFLVVAEGLAGVVRMAIEKDLLESLEIGGRLTKVNMLQFADDTLFLCKASAQSVFVIKAILICFELAFGLKVNL